MLPQVLANTVWHDTYMRAMGGFVLGEVQLGLLGRLSQLIGGCGFLIGAYCNGQILTLVTAGMIGWGALRVWNVITGP